MNKSKARYDAKEKLTRIHLADYMVLKTISQQAGISMAEALHRLIEHQSQLPLLEKITRPVPVAQVTSTPLAIRVAPVTTITTNGNKGVAFRIKPRGVRYD